MSPALISLLILISGVSWTLTYINLIRRGIADKTYGMPLFALTFNLSWEFLFGFFFQVGDNNLQMIVNIVWFCFDLLITYTYLRYGHKEFPKTVDAKWFLPWSLVAFAISFATIYLCILEFGTGMGAAYSAFAQNLMMSLLFIAMLVARNDVRGQSIYIAILKWVGTAAPTLQVSAQSGSKLVLGLGIGCFVFDAIYTGMLYAKFRELGLNPFTRKPLEAVQTPLTSPAA